VRIETHCHTNYSFDCSAKIVDIISECKRKKIDAIVLNDHDVYGLNPSEEELFKANGILVLRAIEFTTEEGVHIIGVHDNIKSLEKPAFFYRSEQLVHKLANMGSWIVLPHPAHETGILGNRKINAMDQALCLKNAHFVEVDNYRYGESKDLQKVLDQYAQIKLLIGSDAHKAEDVGVFCHEIEKHANPMKALYESHNVQFIKTKKRSRLYFIKRKMKKSKSYQFILKRFSYESRQKLKRLLNIEK
jgi:predicted metal-dependent phosphoesterase TrpH